MAYSTTSVAPPYNQPVAGPASGSIGRSEGRRGVAEKTPRAVGGNWEAEQLEAKLSRRVHAVAGAYWGAGARPEPPPVPPIMLAGGVPDPAFLPIDDLVAVSERVLRREGPEALRYGGPQGFLGLREWLASDAHRREGLSLGPEHFTITNGAAGALANLCDTFLDPGDVAIVEAPTYPGAMRTIRSCQAEVLGVPIEDAEGLAPEALEKCLEQLRREGRRPKLLYTMANFQNPAGVTMSLERRREVVELCRRHDVLIVEDDAYGDIRFEGEALPSFFALAGGQGAVRIGTFSKTLATGLRLGWVMADQPIVDALVRMRFDMGSSPWPQRVVTEYASSGLLAEHVKEVVGIYRRKRDVMLAALDERCGRFARWDVPQGGFFLWLELTEGVDPATLAEAAAEEGVAYVGGRTFFPDGSGARYIRLAYSFVAEAEMAEAVLRLGRAMERAARGPSAQ